MRLGGTTIFLYPLVKHMKKYYKIADLIIEMDVSGRTLQQAAPYEVAYSGPADMSISCDTAEILKNNPSLGDADLAEYLVTGILFARRVLAFDGYYLHSSAVILDGKAYLFTAPSGTGKSTHTEKWCRLFGARYLNDDKPVLRCVDGVWMAYGTPWSGKRDLSSNEGVPLGGIIYLQRGQENKIALMEPSRAVPFLMSQTVYRLLREQTEMKLKLLDKILREVPVWEFYCRDDDEAAYISHAAVTKKP